MLVRNIEKRTFRAGKIFYGVMSHKTVVHKGIMLNDNDKLSMLLMIVKVVWWPKFKKKLRIKLSLLCLFHHQGLRYPKEEKRITIFGHSVAASLVNSWTELHCFCSRVLWVCEISTSFLTPWFLGQTHRLNLAEAWVWKREKLGSWINQPPYVFQNSIIYCQTVAASRSSLANRWAAKHSEMQDKKLCEVDFCLALVLI